MTKTNKEAKLADFWSDFLEKEFTKETDRGAVVLTNSLFDNALTNLLKKRLVAAPGGTDELFDGPTAPMSSYSAKIHITYRLGLISARFARDLHIIRKIRNEFAHNIHDSSLEGGKIRDLLTNLLASSKIISNHGEARKSYPSGPRGEFLLVASLMLFNLHIMIEEYDDAAPIAACGEEWLYSFVFKQKSS